MNTIFFSALATLALLCGWRETGAILAYAGFAFAVTGRRR